MKKILTFVLMMSTIFTVSLFGVSFNALAESDTLPVESVCFAQQLDENASKLYDGMKSMYESGKLKKGNGELDLLEDGYVTEQQLKDFMNGDRSLASAFQNARDAFMQDYSHIFYVDFTKLSLRVGQINGSFAAYINSGSNENYFAKGFSSEKQVLDAEKAALSEKKLIVEKIRTTLKLDELENEVVPPSSGVIVPQPKSVAPQDKIATMAHDLLVEKLTYSYPSETDLFVAGVYSIAVDGAKANCIGYASLFKWIMQDFNIPCILVVGNAENSKGVLESHMWNYVTIFDRIYAIDVTWDDPMAARSAKTSKYLLMGDIKFNSNHFATGLFSPGGKQFDYPKISDISYDEYISPNLVDESSDIKIYAKESVSAGVKATTLTIDHLGKSLSELKAEGKYVACRFEYYGKEIGPWVPFDAYVDDNQKPTLLDITRKGAVQFCLTDFDTGTNQLYYKEDLSLPQYHSVISKLFNIPYYSDYVPAPFIHKSAPELTSKIEAEKTFFKVEYDEELVLVDGVPLGAVVNSTENIGGTVSEISMRYSDIILPHTVKKSTVIEFWFDPDTSYQSYINAYSIQLTGVVGKNSRKQPNPIPICVAFDMRIPCPTLVSTGQVSNEAFVISVPTLVVNPNADIFEYDGAQTTNALDIRLVATIPNEDEQKDFENISGEQGIKASAVYELSLACNDYLARLKTDADYNVTIGIPYPKGFNYNDNANVQFKAYHYKKVGSEYVAEEILCRISERGLEVVVNDFSPFMVVAVPKSNVAPSHKFVGVNLRTHGGDVTTTIDNKSGGGTKTASASGVYALNNSGDKRIFTITPQEGYMVDKILVNNKLTNVSGNQIEFDYDSMSGDVDLDIYFVDKKVKTEESAKGFVTIVNSLNREVSSIKVSKQPDKIVYDSGDIFLPDGLVISAIYNDLTEAALDSADYQIIYKGKLSSKNRFIVISLVSDPSITAVVILDVNSNTGLIVGIIIAVVVVMAGATVAVYIVLKKKKSKA